MPNRPASNAATSSAIALLIFAGCVMAFIPPWLPDTLASLPKIILFGIGIAVSLVLHLVFLGIAAQRLGRSPTLWVMLGLLFFPIVSIVGLVLFAWFEDESKAPAGAGVR